MDLEALALQRTILIHQGKGGNPSAVIFGNKTRRRALQGDKIGSPE